MRKFSIPEPEKALREIQGEIKKSPAGRYQQRLHILILLLKGTPARDISQLYDRSVRTIQYWGQLYKDYGLSGLRETPRPGRPPKISVAILKQLISDLKSSPLTKGYNQGFWDGPLLRHHLKNQYQVEITVRHCQRLLHKMGFSLQKPRPKMAGSSVAEAFKKNRRIGG